MLEGVVIFSGATISGPPIEPSPPPEGDVFSGATVSGPASGGSNLGSGGTIFPPGPPTPISAPPSATLILTAVPSPILAARQKYDQVSIASGGIPPYSYALVGGALPEGTELDTSNGSIGNMAEVTGQLLTDASFTYTIEATDSTGIASFTVVGGGTYSGNHSAPNDTVAGGIFTPADNQLVMIVCVTSREATVSDLNQVTAINTSDGRLTFTRIFHDASFTFTDSAGDSGNPVASFSLDIFAAPAPTTIPSTNSIGWSGVMSGDNAVNHGTAFVISVGGLKNINAPLDPAALPNVALNTSGTSSAPANTDVTTSNASDALFSVIINHDASGDTAPVAFPGWTMIGTLNNEGGASGFSLFMTTKTVTEVQSSASFTAGFSDNFWYSAILAFETVGGSPLSATATITGNVSPVVPGSQTFLEGSGYFFAPPYNTLTAEVFGGSETGSQIIGTFGGITAAGVDGFAEIVYTPESPLAPPVTGAIPYSVGEGSPSGMITFTWS